MEVAGAPSLILDPAYMVLRPGDTFILTASVLPPSFANKNVAWGNSNPDIAEITGAGLSVRVEALEVGSTLITATAEEGGLTASCQVVVVPSAYMFIIPFNTVNDYDEAASGTANGPFSKFTTLSIDGKVLEEGTDYIIEPDENGFSVFYLQPSYLATLQNGSYLVQAVYTDGVAETTLIVDVHNPDVTMYTITPSAGRGGSINPAENVRVAEGGSAFFQFQPAPGYAVSKVLVDGEPVENSNDTYTFRDVRENHTISVEFEPSPNPGDVYYTIKAAAGSGGSISVSGDILVHQGADFTFYFTPQEGYHVSKVIVDGAIVNTNGEFYTFTDVESNHTITVEFEPLPDPEDVYYTIKATAGSGGSISVSGDILVRQGADFTFYFTPQKGYHVSRVIVDGAIVNTNGKFYTFTNVESNHTITVEFAKDADSGNGNGSGNGSGSGSGNGSGSANGGGTAGTATPQTGDSSNLMLWYITGLAAIFVIIGVLMRKYSRGKG